MSPAEVALVALRDGVGLSDEAAESLLAAQPDDAARKQLVMRLYDCDVISMEQCALAFYLYPNMREA